MKQLRPNLHAKAPAAHITCGCGVGRDSRYAAQALGAPRDLAEAHPCWPLRLLLRAHPTASPTLPGWALPTLRAGPHSAVGEGPLALGHTL